MNKWFLKSETDFRSSQIRKKTLFLCKLIIVSFLIFSFIILFSAREFKTFTQSSRMFHF